LAHSCDEFADEFAHVVYEFSVRQHLAVDGRLHIKFDITPRSSSGNYTRSYYLNGRDYIISGSCEENVVRVLCAQTGRRLRDIAVEVNFVLQYYLQILESEGNSLSNTEWHAYKNLDALIITMLSIKLIWISQLINHYNVSIKLEDAGMESLSISVMW
jgi:hypothetical protein